MVDKLSAHPRFYELTREEEELHSAKNADYRSDTNPTANFDRVAAWMALYPKMNWATSYGVALVYAMKQQDAALSLMERGVEGGVENVDTRLRDVHVYYKLARILYEQEHTKTLDERIGMTIDRELAERVDKLAEIHKFAFSSAQWPYTSPSLKGE